MNVFFFITMKTNTIKHQVNTHKIYYNQPRGSDGGAIQYGKHEQNDQKN